MKRRGFIAALIGGGIATLFARLPWPKQQPDTSLAWGRHVTWWPNSQVIHIHIETLEVDVAKGVYTYDVPNVLAKIHKQNLIDRRL